MKKHVIHVYNIGQGLCTMLRTEPDGENDYLGIFDCGFLREGRNKEAVTNAIAAYAQEHGHIDSIVISHQDLDHRSLLLDIIWEFYGVTSDTIIRQNDFYFKKKKETNILYELLKDGGIVYSNFSEVDGYNSDFSVKVDNDNYIQRFELSRRVDKSLKSGQCVFKLSWKNEYDKMTLSVFIDDALERKEMESGHSIAIPYEEDFFISVPWGGTFPSSEWKYLKQFIGELRIYEQIEGIIGFNSEIRSRWRRFLDNIDEFTNKINYNIMKQKLSRPTNFESYDQCIKKIWLGGDHWEIGYRRLHYILKKLVKLGLVDNVNGFTKDSSFTSDGDNKRFCGLMRVNEETICSDEVEPQTFAIDENLKDCIKNKIVKISSAIWHNASSLIVEFNTSTEETSRRIIYPGDATVHVFGQLANALDGPDVFSNTFFIAPHHGSLHTNYCGGTQQPFHMLLDKLTAKKIVKLNACVISALGEVYGHPDKRFVYDMREYVKPDHPSVPVHSICYFEGSIRRIRRIENESKEIYCTEMMRSIGRRWYSDPPQQDKTGRTEQRKIFPKRNVFI